MRDWHSRYVVSGERDQTRELGFVLEVRGQALQTATPQICNSGPGSQFTSPQRVGLRQEARVRISMDGKGRRQIISLGSGCGGRSSTKEYICTIMPARGRQGNLKRDGVEEVWANMIETELPFMPEAEELARTYGDFASDLMHSAPDSAHMKLCDKYWTKDGKRHSTGLPLKWRNDLSDNWRAHVSSNSRLIPKAACREARDRINGR